MSSQLTDHRMPLSGSHLPDCECVQVKIPDVSWPPKKPASAAATTTTVTTTPTTVEPQTVTPATNVTNVWKGQLQARKRN